MMRTRRTVPAGTVTVVGAAGAGAGAGAGAAAAAGAAGGLTLMFLMLAYSMICMPALVSKRTVSAVPPRYLPCSTVPFLSSRVSARTEPAQRARIADRNRVVNFFMMGKIGLMIFFGGRICENRRFTR